MTEEEIQASQRFRIEALGMTADQVGELPESLRKNAESVRFAHKEFWGNGVCVNPRCRVCQAS